MWCTFRRVHLETGFGLASIYLFGQKKPREILFLFCNFQVHFVPLVVLIVIFPFRDSCFMNARERGFGTSELLKVMRKQIAWFYERVASRAPLHFTKPAIQLVALSTQLSNDDKDLHSFPRFSNNTKHLIFDHLGNYASTHKISRYQASFSY